MAETTTTISRPAPFIETMGKTFGEGIMRLGAQPVPTAGFAPSVADQGVLGQEAQQAAATQAGLGQLQFGPQGQVTGVGAGTGISGCQPYMDAAKGYGTAAAPFGTAAGTQATAAAGQVAPMGAYGTAAAGLTGPMSTAQLAAYESPYTNQVIQSMRDQMADVKAKQDISRNTQAIGAGAFGGARSGVQQSVADTEYNRMVGQMVAQQEQAGFGQAQQARQQDYMNQLGLGQYAQGIGQYQQGLGQQQLGLGQYQQGLAQQQLGLGQYQQGMGAYQQGMAQLQPQLAGQQIGQLGQFGQQGLGYRQAVTDAAAQSAKLAAYEPYQRYGFMGENITGLMGGYPGGTRMTTQPGQSPMAQALGLGLGAMGTYAGMNRALGT